MKLTSHYSKLSMYLACLLTLSTGCLQAQPTNTFPDIGNTGIGTTNPAAILNVVAADNAAALLMQDSTTDQAAKNGLIAVSHFLNDEEPLAIIHGRTDNLGTNNGNTIYIGGNDLGLPHNAANAIRFFTAPDNTTTLGGTERMRITKDGKVSIGANNNNCEGKLTLQNLEDFEYAIVTKSTTSPHGFNGIQMRNNLNNPYHALEFGMQGSDYGAISGDDSYGASGELGYIGTTGAYPFSFIVENEVRMLICDNGNVMIGRYSRAGEDNGALLQVAGSVTTGNIYGNEATFTGNVGIGKANPVYKLEVNGTIRTKEVIVESSPWPDYVFAADYRLAPLSEVEQHIKTHQRLPGLPSAQAVAEEGVHVGEMQSKLLAKMEELTLYIIELHKENAKLLRTVEIFSRDVRR